MSAATFGTAWAPDLRSPSPIVLAVLFSVVSHVALLIWGPMWQHGAPEFTPPPLLASLQPAAPAQQPASPAPQPPQPQSEVKRAVPKPEPKPQVKAERRSEPAPREKPVIAASPVATAPAQREEVVAALPSAPAVEAAETIVAPEPPSIAPYQSALNIAAQKYREYPRYARQREWEGRVMVRMDIGIDGRVRQIAVSGSSGYELLDNTAMEMLRKAQRDTPVPDALRGRAFIVEVAVLFELKD